MPRLTSNCLEFSTTVPSYCARLTILLLSHHLTFLTISPSYFVTILLLSHHLTFLTIVPSYHRTTQVRSSLWEVDCLRAHYCPTVTSYPNPNPNP